MIIGEAIGKACGVHGASAFRPTGLMVIVTRQGGLRVPKKGGTKAFLPNLQDVVADDWELMTPEQTERVIAGLEAPVEQSA